MRQMNTSCSNMHRLHTQPRNGMCFWYSHRICRMFFCTLPLVLLTLRCYCCWFMLLLLLLTLYGSYCRHCQSKIFRGVCLEFMKNFFNGIFTFQCAFRTLHALTRKSNYLKYVKKNTQRSPAIENCATCTWKHAFICFVQRNKRMYTRICMLFCLFICRNYQFSLFCMLYLPTYFFLSRSRSLSVSVCFFFVSWFWD